MDTDNDLNNTQEVTNTRSPQEAAPSQGASDAADFQSTAPSDALRQEAAELSVEETGDPLNGTTNGAADYSAWVWGIGTLLLVIISIVVIARILKEEAEADQIVTVSTATKKKSVTKKSAKKKPAKKSSGRKKTSKPR